MTEVLLRVSVLATLYIFWQLIIGTFLCAFFFGLLFVCVLSLVLYANFRVPRLASQLVGPVGLQRAAVGSAVCTKKRERSTSVMVCTWNVGDAAPPAVSELQAFFQQAFEQGRRGLDKSAGERPDLIAVGAQECAYPSTDGESSCESHWVKTLHAALGGDDCYTLVGAVSVRESIRLVVFAASALRGSVSNVQITAEALVPVFYRKGGQAITFYLHDTSYCFVNCHLWAHAGARNCRHRNNAVAALTRSLSAGNPLFSVAAQFDHCFWFGDMNYRIDKQLGRDDVLAAVDVADWPRLWRHDELNTEHAQRRVLSEFELPRPHFAPTYQYEVGRLPRRYADNKKKRTPAWCDRVLYRSQSTSAAVHFAAADTIATSDHSPVYAMFFTRTVVFDSPPPAQPPLCYTLVARKLRLAGWTPPRSYCQVLLSGADALLQRTDYRQRQAVARSQKLLLNQRPDQDREEPAWTTPAQCPPPLLTWPCAPDCLAVYNLLVAVYDYADPFLDRSLVGEGWLSLRSHTPGTTREFAVPLSALGVATDAVLHGELTIEPYPYSDIKPLLQ